MAQQMKQADEAEGKGGKAQTENVFNTARGNSVRFKEQQQAQAPQQSPAEMPALRQPQAQNAPAADAAVRLAIPQPVTAAAGPAALQTLTGAPAMTEGARGVDAQAQAFGGGVGGGGVQQGMASAEDEARRMQTAGRISLAVDFPTEGQVLHFKKVKANAHLALTTSTPETWVRWQYLALALALAGVLGAVRRLVERRGRAAAL